ncbi:MAG: hypothetical protein COZ49_03635 [Candidatus Yonathbacteria bacterium CG_4_10_14_3_um_filter_47_65]|uniref:Uncharacterized protein n=2 Tax=Parcubacteria group TaxID=1794811 RepID=A0A2M8D7S7_9BACT|nr:MAG: hypothetical protein AUJ44_00440 [Candidatus Nomurabacteria bacterium CG1_02_47_685]PIP04241.1 MAG: hypothetical protein COX54_00135 [Candidatus Yonathbacteria bacterium CG23_combo_of_CG06-09_8_20_14_all_46_18]PIQ31942.1 MAG: hypothetical protein COW61_02800 [Candidatus Yonathbacteria bacterium CG17_big_fil_post_rev_8_21_14_2_50_46_19]PIX56150.1 MAG: hypothetical protein COZ49_03635 [Candidatus Yonathbacteria bacterium CG_4_10_14_3_um_filter_47_65]PIY57994.1 MAG: hypothetical protein CO
MVHAQPMPPLIAQLSTIHLPAKDAKMEADVDINNLTNNFFATSFNTEYEEKMKFSFMFLDLNFIFYPNFCLLFLYILQ